MLVVPGLIDLHAHVFRGIGIGADADRDCLGRGTTTVADGGSSGSCSFEGFREFIVKPSRVGVYAWLNLSSTGIVDARVGELLNVDTIDVDGALRTVEANRDAIVGIKVGLGIDVVGGASLRVLEIGRRVCDAARIPAMLHVVETPEPLSEVLEYCRPGSHHPLSAWAAARHSRR